MENGTDIPVTAADKSGPHLRWATCGIRLASASRTEEDYDRDSGEVIRSEFPRKKFLRQGHRERYTADGQEGDKGNLPSDSRRVQRIS
jgi:hypothetical protein